MLEVMDTFIGMVTIYLILSLVVTALGEGFSTNLNFRGTTLLRIVVNLLGEDLALKLFSHANIRVLCSKPGKSWFGNDADGMAKVLSWGRFTDGTDIYRLPSYLPPELFAKTLLDIVVDDPLSGGNALTPALIDRALRPGDDSQINTAQKSPSRPPHINHLHSLWVDANYDIDRFKVAIVTWFDQTADRANGWFKRRLNLYLLLSGFVVAAFINADTIKMFQTLSNDDAARQQLVDTAIKLSQTPANGELDIDKLKTTLCESDESLAAGEDALKNSSECKARIHKKLLPQLLPLLGWENVGHPLDKLCWSFEADCRLKPWSWDLTIALFLKFIGLFLTAAAISLGAPFWFDLLNKVIQVRGKIATSTSAAASTPPRDGNKQPAKAAIATAPTARSLIKQVSVNNETLDSLTTFNDRNFGYDPVNMYWCARLSNLAYEGKEVTKKILQELGATGELIEHRESHTQCLIAQTPKAVILAFRGTEQAREDWMTDAKFDQISQGRPVQEPASAGHSKDEAYLVHRGFYEALFSKQKSVDENGGIENHPGQMSQEVDNNVEPAYQLILAKVNEMTQDGKVPVWVTGHSLGGALAVLMALELSLLGKTTIGGIFTFGQPRVGNAKLLELIDGHFPQRYYRSVNHRDVVPRLPPPISINTKGEKFKYAHGGHVLYFNDAGQAIMDPPIWYRAIDAVDTDIGDEEENPAGSTSRQKFIESLREFVSDHGMGDYVKLHASLLSLSTSDNPPSP